MAPSKMFQCKKECWKTKEIIDVPLVVEMCILVNISSDEEIEHPEGRQIKEYWYLPL